MFEGADFPLMCDSVSLPELHRWKIFRLGDLFSIKKGKRLTKADMIPGDIPYIGASDTANGVTARIGQAPIHESGTISVSYDGSIAEAFFQPEPYWASDAVNVLYPKGFQLTPSVALFICAVIRLEKYRFNYGRKWHLKRMKESEIKLPTDSHGIPDWRLMSDYIRSRKFSSVIGEQEAQQSAAHAREARGGPRAGAT
jgi:hypothetical protein